jgi:WD40 repeat protein
MFVKKVPAQSANDPQTVRLWSTESGTPIGSPLNGHSRIVTSVVWNNDGTKLSTGSDDETIWVWSVGSAGTFECQSPLSGHSDP